VVTKEKVSNETKKKQLTKHENKNQNKRKKKKKREKIHTFTAMQSLQHTKMATTDDESFQRELDAELRMNSKNVLKKYKY
jgi:hypothetical protein